MKVSPMTVTIQIHPCLENIHPKLEQKDKEAKSVSKETKRTGEGCGD